MAFAATSVVKRCDLFAVLPTRDGEEDVLECRDADGEIGESAVLSVGEGKQRDQGLLGLGRDDLGPMHRHLRVDHGREAPQFLERQRVAAEHDPRRGAERGDELGRRVERDDPAPVDDADVVAQLLGLLEVVGREDDRPPLGPTAEMTSQRLRRACGSRPVVGSSRKTISGRLTSAGRGGPLLLPTGHLVHRRRALRFEPDHREQLVEPAGLDRPVETSEQRQ